MVGTSANHWTGVMKFTDGRFAGGMGIYFGVHVYTVYSIAINLEYVILQIFLLIHADSSMALHVAALLPHSKYIAIRS
jgi:hypothetical protein